MKYGGKGILFQEIVDPFGKIDSGMPDTAIADLRPGPVIGNASGWAKWSAAWPEGFPQWTAELYESSDTFRARIIGDLTAAGNLGHVVFIFTRPGFWQRNQGGVLLATQSA